MLGPRAASPISFNCPHIFSFGVSCDKRLFDCTHNRRGCNWICAFSRSQFRTFYEIRRTISCSRRGKHSDGRKRLANSRRNCGIRELSSCACMLRVSGISKSNCTMRKNFGRYGLYREGIRLIQFGRRNEVSVAKIEGQTGVRPHRAATKNSDPEVERPDDRSVLSGDCFSEAATSTWPLACPVAAALRSSPTASGAECFMPMLRSTAASSREALLT